MIPYRSKNQLHQIMKIHQTWAKRGRVLAKLLTRR